MIEIIVIIVGAYLVIQTLARNVLLGLLVMLLLLAYLLFKRYTSICIAMAMRNYTKGDKDKAFDWFERGYKHGMTIHQKANYSYYLLREGRVERSEQILNAILGFRIEKAQDKYLVKSQHALLLLKTDRMDEALEELEEIFPYYKNTNIYGSLGYLYIMKGDKEKALEFNKEAYDYNSDNHVILDNMVQLYIMMEDYEESYKYVQELMEKNPAFIEAYYNAAVVEKALGKSDEAKKHLEHALTITPSFISTISHEDVNKLLSELEGSDGQE